MACGAAAASAEATAVKEVEVLEATAVELAKATPEAPIAPTLDTKSE